MKLIIVLCLAGLAIAAPQQDAQILRYDNDIGDNGNFRWGFQTSDGTSHDQQGELKNQGREDEAAVMRGRYSWVGPDGVTYIVTYTADENGFQPEIEQGPGGAVPPGVVASLLG